MLETITGGYPLLEGIYYSIAIPLLETIPYLKEPHLVATNRWGDPPGRGARAPRIRWQKLRPRQRGVGLFT